MKTAFRFIVVGVLFSLFFSAAGVQAQAVLQPGPAQFCLQSFNAYGPLYAPYVMTRTEKMAGFFRTNPTCEVIHLQEVWMESQAGLLGKSLQDRFAVSAPNLEQKIGLMSFTLSPYQQTQTHLFLKNNEGGVMDGVRQALHIYKAFHAVEYQPVSTVEPLWFINLHLHQSSESIRVSQLLEILQWRLQNPDLKWILSGDFNADLQGPERDFIMNAMGLHDAMEEALGGYGAFYCTYCSGNRLGWLSSSKVFDYVFYSKTGGDQAFYLKPVQGEINMRGTQAAPWSDHYGLRVTFELEQVEDSSTAPDVTARTQGALKSILRSEALLSEKPTEFASELLQLKELRTQLVNQSGPYWNYFLSLD